MKIDKDLAITVAIAASVVVIIEGGFHLLTKYYSAKKKAKRAAEFKAAYDAAGVAAAQATAENKV